MSTSATSFKATRTIRQFRRQQGDDYMQTFGALQEEKRRRLLDTATAGAAAGPQLSKQQMNDFDRRLYTVVQRMSAFNRYRRKRKKTTTTQIEHHSSQPNDRIAQLQAEINDDWKRLISNLQINAKIYRQWANELPGQQPTVETQEQPQQQASAFDVQRNAFRNAIMGLLKSPEQQMRDEERIEEKRVRYALEDQIRLGRLEQERAEAVEQRTVAAKRYQQAEDHYQAESARMYRQIDKLRANREWHTEWSNRRPLIVQRRANQSANAG